MPGLRAKVMSTLAGQLGNPHGLLGKGVARILNRGNRPLIEAAAEAATGTVVADIGFGGGVGLELLLARSGTEVVHGVELSPDMLARARSTFARDLAAGRLRLSAGSLTALPFADDSLDAAITVNTIYFLSDLDAACAELARAVRTGGAVVIGIGDPDAMAAMPFTAYGFTLRPVAEVRAALERAGCTVTERQLPSRPIPTHLLVAVPG
ncbi:class I SAM-dependent methyltransferase [Nocardia sp. NPDC127579]|uniref:class I SAM-dependent methyltransferase n=1 Tax=Nocardia sp. NPDC127579 TaxID=3345402 RepID=UPI0036445BAE